MRPGFFWFQLRGPVDFGSLKINVLNLVMEP